MMIKISACILTKNEEGSIERCLENIKDYVDEIVIVDGFSGDITVEIARKYTDKIYQKEFSGSFAVERNYSIEKSTGEWILVIDADETLSKELQDNLRSLTQQDEYSAYAFARRHYYEDSR